MTAKGQPTVTVSTADSYLSSKDKRVHFGLGTDHAAETIEIRWPSGNLQVLKDVPAEQILEIKEPATTDRGPSR